MGATEEVIQDESVELDNNADTETGESVLVIDGSSVVDNVESYTEVDSVTEYDEAEGSFNLALLFTVGLLIGLKIFSILSSRWHA